jgi:hypothetical protein
MRVYINLILAFGLIALFGGVGTSDTPIDQDGSKLVAKGAYCEMVLKLGNPRFCLDLSTGCQTPSTKRVLGL